MTEKAVLTYRYTMYAKVHLDDKEIHLKVEVLGNPNNLSQKTFEWAKQLYPRAQVIEVGRDLEI